jgi:hypothetical protein
MIKVTAQTDISILVALRDEMSDWDALVAGVGERAKAQTSAETLARLQREPGAVKYPIQWTSERQRRAFFATNGFGAGIPYRRTGGLARSWVITNAIQSGRYTITLANTSRAAKFVYGTLNMQSLNDAMRPQQQFHPNTGWLTAQPIAVDWINAVRASVEEQFYAMGNELTVRIRRRSRRS